MRVTGNLERRWLLLDLCFLVICGILFGGAAAGAGGTAGAEDVADSSGASFGQLFTGSACPAGYGVLGCTQQPTDPSCNPNWNTYFSTTPSSITMTAGSNDCRTVNTYDQCLFNLGTGGITEISFDFTVADSCHGASGTEWLAFWMYHVPWTNQVEVDFIESKYGPGAGLNTNFAGVGTQVIIFNAGTTGWKGSITATFTSGAGGTVNASVSNSVNKNVGTTTLSTGAGYFFVMDTAGGSTATDCSFTISNLTAKGTVPAGTCAGLISN